MNIVKILGVAVGALAIGAAALSIANPNSFAETSADAHENLRTRIYKTDLREFVENTEQIIPSLSTYGKNWKIVSTNASENSTSIKAEVPVLIFIDDLEIKAVYNQSTNETTVNIRSAARLGSSDLGENRRHVLQILKVLDERFAR